MKTRVFKILKEGSDRLTVSINGKERRLVRRTREKYIAPSRKGIKWWPVTGEGKGHSREIKVVCNGVEYRSVSECARQLGISKSTVSRILAGKKSEFNISKRLTTVV